MDECKQMKAKKTLKNIIFGIIYELVLLVSGFTVPRLILTHFGSDYNGLVSSITQFLNVASLFQAGIGAVTLAALYKPLQEKDVVKTSAVLKTTNRFLIKVSLLFVMVLFIIAVVYPFLVKEQFDWFFTFSLALILGFSTYIQYFLVVSYRLLLRADQKQWIVYLVDTIKIILNTAFAVILIVLGYGIREVKFVSALIFLAAPIYLMYYCKKKYTIIKNIKTDNGLIKQRWDNFTIQVAGFVQYNCDLIVLSFFSNVFEMSVYDVYRLVANGIKALIEPLTYGVGASFGHMFAEKKDNDIISLNFCIYEELVFGITTILYGVCFVLILSFVKIYTKDITDVEYIRPVFSIVFLTSSLLTCWKIPYDTIVNAVGHFKQMRIAAVIEVTINVLVSLLLVKPYGLTGVAIGTICAMIYRLIQFSTYVSKHIIIRSPLVFIKRIFVSVATVAIIAILGNIMPLPSAARYVSWIGNGVIITVFAVVITVIIEFICYKNIVFALLRMFKRALLNKNVDG
jgi:O-antigen/teichoic acid export membrane protein